MERTVKTLILSDDSYVVETLRSWLEKAGHSVVVAPGMDEARRLMAQTSLDLALTDPVTRDVYPEALADLIRGYSTQWLVLLAFHPEERYAFEPYAELGADGYILRPFIESEVLRSVSRSLENRRLKSMEEEFQFLCEAQVRSRTLTISERESEIVFRLAAALGVRSDETRNHVRRVGLNAALVAKRLGWSAEEVDDLRLAAALHDIGELSIPDSILLKPGKLSPEEFALVKKHTQLGANLLDGSNVPMLQMAADIARAHHEKWDGSGYPLGLSGEDIPESARIVAVVDVYDALMSERVYRPPLPSDEALAIMQANREKYFDPKILDCFLHLLPEIEFTRSADPDDDDPELDFGDSPPGGN